jgi:CHAD domain-containing protein
LRIAASDPEARRGDGDGIHRLRTSIRRLRSELLALNDFVDRPWRDQVEGELKWLAGLLGDVRDLDLLLARLRKAVPSPGQDGAGMTVPAPLLSALRARRVVAARALDDGLASDRYRRLLAALQKAADRPPLQDAACVSCSASLPPVAAAAWRRLKKAAKNLRPSDPVEDFHKVRKRAKRARYTAELVAPVLSRGARGARRFIRLTTEIQDTLGEHHDAIVAIQEIQHALGGQGRDPAVVKATKRLIQAQRSTADAARAKFFKIWGKLDRKKSHRWMRNQPKAKAATGA